MVITLVLAWLGDGSSILIALRDMLYRSNINNDDGGGDDDDDDDGSIHVSIQYTTTTIYSWAEYLLTQ